MEETVRSQKSKSISVQPVTTTTTENNTPVKKRTSDKSNDNSNNSEVEQNYDTISLTVFGKLGVGKSKLIER
jgi:predicted GTPase